MTTIRVPVLLHIEVDTDSWFDAYGIEPDDVPEDVAILAADAVSEHLNSVVGDCRVGDFRPSISFLNETETVGVEFRRTSGEITVITRESRDDMWSPPITVKRPNWASL